MANSSSPSSKKRNTKANQFKENEFNANSPFEILSAQEERINPAILLAEELMRKDLAEILDYGDLERAEITLAEAKDEINRVALQFEALTKSPATASEQIPLGF